MRRRRTAAVLSAIACASPALAQTFSWTGAKSTLWNDPTTAGTVTSQPNWSPSTAPPAPPNDPGADVTIGPSFTVDANGLFTVGRLKLDTNSTLNVPTGLSLQPGAFTGSGTITNNGTISVSSNAAFGNSHTTSDVTLTGSGTITLNGGLLAPNNVGYNGRFVNASNTIQGTGTIGQSFAGAASLSFTNQGVVDANVPYTGSNPLTWAIVDPGSGTTFGVNSGTLRASNSGRLVLSGGSLDNTGGTILATGGGSQVSVANSEIIGGTLQTSVNGSVQTADLANPTLNGVTIVGRFQVTNHSSAGLKGTIQNFGTIALASTNAAAILAGNASAGATLTGGGIVAMEGGNNDNRINGVVTNVDNTIQGVGLIDCTSFTNQGTVSANVPYTGSNALTIWNGFTNTGTIQAAAGGRLQFQFSGVINNTGGTIRALNGSAIDIAGNAADIRGGTLATSGTGSITGSNVTFRGLTNAGSYTVSGSSSLFIDGVITNNGSINLPNPFSSINLAGSSVLAGGGTVNLNAATIGSSSNGLALTNNANTIRGTGAIGNGVWNVFNHSAITADVPYVPANDNSLTVRLGPAGSNTSGTLRATNGGRLVLVGGTTENDAGTVVADAGSEVHLLDVRLKHGTLGTAGTGVIKIDNSFGTKLEDLTITGNVVEENQQFNGFFTGTITNNGTFTIGNARMAATSGNLTFSGGGAVILNGANAVLDGDGTSKVIINNALHTIRGSGQLGQSDIQVTNNGTILADSDTVPLTVNTSLGLSNSGVIRAAGAAGLAIGHAKVVNTAKAILSSVNHSTLTINTPLTMQGGTIDATSLVVAQGVDITLPSVKVGSGALVIHGPFTITGGSFSVDAGKVILDGAAYDLAAITTYARNGYNGGAWDLGLVSAAVGADAQHVTALAVADNAVLGFTTYADQPVVANSILIQLAYYGDTNLDGRVNADDYVRTDRGLAKGLAGWANGDFNYDDTVDGMDYQLIDRGFALQGNPLSAEFLAARASQFGEEYVSQLLASIPEPSVAALLVLPLVRRRRRI